MTYRMVIIEAIHVAMNDTKTRRNNTTQKSPEAELRKDEVILKIARHARRLAITTTPKYPPEMAEFYSSYSVTVGLNTAFVLGGILFVTVVYLLYKTKCRKPLRRQFRKVLVYIKGAPQAKITDNKCVGTNIQLEPSKGSWICFDNPDIAPSVEIDALKATALWIMQNNEEELQNLENISGIILRVDPDVIHAHQAKAKACMLNESMELLPAVTVPHNTYPYYDNDTTEHPMLQVPVDNHFLQIPDICVETPRPTSELSTNPISFARQDRLHNSTSHPSFDRTTWNSTSSNLCVDREPLQFRSQPSLPVERVMSVPTIITDTAGAKQHEEYNSDSQTEDDPLLRQHSNLQRYIDEVSRDKKSSHSRRSSQKSQKSNESHRSSYKSRSSKVKGTEEQLHELLPSSSNASLCSSGVIGSTQNRTFLSHETIL